MSKTETIGPIQLAQIEALKRRNLFKEEKPRGPDIVGIIGWIILGIVAFFGALFIGTAKIAGDRFKGQN